MGCCPACARAAVAQLPVGPLQGVLTLSPAVLWLHCRYDVDAVASMVSDYTADIGRSLDALRLSGSLQYLLAFVRDVANTMNRAGPKGPLEGFKLESLARLQVGAARLSRGGVCVLQLMRAGCC